MRVRLTVLRLFKMLCKLILPLLKKRQYDLLITTKHLSKKRGFKFLLKLYYMMKYIISWMYADNNLLNTCLLTGNNQIISNSPIWFMIELI